MIVLRVHELYEVETNAIGFPMVMSGDSGSSTHGAEPFDRMPTITPI